MLTRLRSACSQIVEVNWSRAHSFWKADVMDTKRTVFFRGVAGGKVSGLSQERCWCCKGESSYRSPNEAQRRVVDRTHSNVVSSVVGERAVRAAINHQASVCWHS